MEAKRRPKGNRAPEQHYRLTRPQRSPHPTKTENTCFSSTHETFSITDYMLGHKANLSKFKKTQIIKSTSPNIMKPNFKKPAEGKQKNFKNVEIKQFIFKPILERRQRNFKNI